MLIALASWAHAQNAVSGGDAEGAADTELTIGADGQWVQASAPEPGSDAAVLAEARALLAADKPGRAFNVIDDWLDDNETSRSPLLSQAYLLRADARTANGNEFKALYDYETVINDFPADRAFVDAVERELEIGTLYLHGLRRKWLGLARLENAKPLGTELLMRVQERLPGSRLAETAAVELADFFYREGELDLAADMYDILLRNFPDTEHRVHATERRIYSNIGKFKGPKYSAAGLVESRALIEEYRSRYPAESSQSGIGDALTARIDHSQAAQMLETSRWYIKRNDTVSARFTLQRLVRRHPATSSAVEAVAILRENGWWDVNEAEGLGPLGEFSQPAEVVEADVSPANQAADVAAEPTSIVPERRPAIGEMTPVENGGGR